MCVCAGFGCCGTERYARCLGKQVFTNKRQRVVFCMRRRFEVCLATRNDSSRMSSMCDAMSSRVFEIEIRLAHTYTQAQRTTKTAQSIDRRICERIMMNIHKHFICWKASIFLVHRPFPGTHTQLTCTSYYIRRVCLELELAGDWRAISVLPSGGEMNNGFIFFSTFFIFLIQIKFLEINSKNFLGLAR